MKSILTATLVLLAAGTLHLCAADPEDGFVSIFDGKTFEGWKPATEPPRGVPG